MHLLCIKRKPSLFNVLPQVLNHQYRMHPDIAAFPAAEFYENALLNGEAVKAGTMRAWHDHPVRSLPKLALPNILCALSAGAYLVRVAVHVIPHAQGVTCTQSALCLRSKCCPV